MMDSHFPASDSGRGEIKRIHAIWQTTGEQGRREDEMAKQRRDTERLSLLKASAATLCALVVE